MTAFSNTPDDIYEDARRDIASRRENAKESRSEQFGHGLQSRHTPDDGGLGAAFEQVFGRPLSHTPRPPISAEQQRYEDFLEDKAETRKWERMGY